VCACDHLSIAGGPPNSAASPGVASARGAFNMRCIDSFRQEPAMPAVSRAKHPEEIARRIDAIDWRRAGTDLDDHGCAVVEGMLSAPECDALAALYAQDGRFRSRVDMARH